SISARSAHCSSHSASCFPDNRDAASQSNASARSISIANIYRSESADVFALRGARRLAVLSSAQSDSSPALLGHCSWRGFPPIYLDHLSPFALGRRARRKVWIQNPPGYRPVNCSSWLCAFYVARLGRRLLAIIFPCSCCARNRHGCKRRASDHHGDEFRRTESCRHCFRRQQRSCQRSWTARDRRSWNRHAPLI